MKVPSHMPNVGVSIWDYIPCEVKGISIRKVLRRRVCTDFFLPTLADTYAFVVGRHVRGNGDLKRKCVCVCVCVCVCLCECTYV